MAAAFIAFERPQDLYGFWRSVAVPKFSRGGKLETWTKTCGFGLILTHTQIIQLGSTTLKGFGQLSHV